MQKLLIFVAVAALCLLAEAAHAKEIIVKLTQQQVATTCGKLMVTGEGGARGSRKGCGDGKTCGYGCDKNGKNCYGRVCLLYTSPSPRDRQKSRMPSSA